MIHSQRLLARRFPRRARGRQTTARLRKIRPVALTRTDLTSEFKSRALVAIKNPLGKKIQMICNHFEILR